MIVITPEQGIELVKAARAAVLNHFFGKDIKLNGLEQKTGLFVTINNYPKLSLRGCMGLIEPTKPLKDAVILISKSAAFADDRFKPLQHNEMDKVVFEVAVIGQPELIRGKMPEDYIRSIQPGKDGIIIDADGHRGLLLPEASSGRNITPEMALNMTCRRAGLLDDTWKQEKCNIYRFKAQIFSEKEPGGEILARQ
jgi:uncharacterized protein